MSRLTSLLLIVGIVRICGYELPPNYENQTAASKQEQMWSIMEEGIGGSGSYPNFFTLSRFLCCEDIEGSVSHYEDSLPYDHSKRIHSVGGVAKAIWKNVGDHNYTGLFSQNETMAFVRLSYAGEPSRTGTTPGIGLKLFRDGLPSANLVAMKSLSGQSSGNFFQEIFSNHVEAPPGSSILNLLESKFNDVSSPATMVGLSDFASFNETGDMLAMEDIQFPFRLMFHPNPELQNKFKGARPRDSLQRMLASIANGTKLYDIYALSAPNSVGEEKIGELYTSSDIIFSDASDNFLFFRHQKMMEDFALRPEWGDSDDRLGRRLINCPHLRAHAF